MAAFLSLSAIILMICVFDVLCDRDEDILEFVSPPFSEVAQQLYDNTAIQSLLNSQHAYDYNPSWGKSGISFSIIYYVRNARMAAQYMDINSEESIIINNANHLDIWSKMFQWEMDIFSKFRAWYDDSSDLEKWKSFMVTTAAIFKDELFKQYLYLNVNVSMPIFEENIVGPKYLTKGNNDIIESDLEFDRITPFIPSTNDGFPLIGFGSWPLTGSECKEAVLLALKTGYRLIDTSENYNNEVVIGEAIRESGLERNKILIASKLSDEKHYGEGVTSAAFYKTLDNLQVDYMDIYMLHGAIGDKRKLREAWVELETLYKANKIRYLGVSNFSPNDMNFLMRFATIKPRFVQNKYDPFTHGQQIPWLAPIEEWVINYNSENAEDYAILIQGYCVLNAWPHQIAAVHDLHIKWIADKYHVTCAQLLIRWALQHKNVAILTRSSNELRQLENLNVFDFEINDIDMQLINGLNTLFAPFDIQWMHDVYGQVTNRPHMKPHQEL